MAPPQVRKVGGHLPQMSHPGSAIEQYVQSNFVSFFSFSFSSNMMSAVIEAIDLTDKGCLLESRVETGELLFGWLSTCCRDIM